MARESRVSLTHRTLDGFLLAQACLFVLPIFTAYLHPVLLGNMRNVQILLVLFFVASLYFRGAKMPDILSWQLRPEQFRSLAVLSLISFLATGLTHYFGIKLNGEDFSIFDWMLYNTNHREFMTSPICNMAPALGVCHHFAIHPTYIMMPLAILHRYLEHPLFLVSLHSIALWIGIFPIRQLAKKFLESDFLVLAVLLAYLSNAYLGAILNHGFHVEVFYVPLGLYFLTSWFSSSPWMWLYLLGFLSIKEDAAFYMIAFVAMQYLRNPLVRARCLMIFFLALAVLLLNILLVQPYFLRLTQADAPSYLRFWGHLGHTKLEIIRFIFSSPWQCLQLILSSYWYLIFGSLLFLPLLSLEAMAPILPVLIIYGLSNNPHMREYASYYSAPLLPFLFFALVDAMHRIRRWRLPQNNWAIIGLLACGLFSLSGGGYQKFPTLDRQILTDLAEARQYLKVNSPTLICAETLLFPHLPYAMRLQALSLECLHEASALTVLLNNSRYDSYPLNSKELTELVRSVPELELVQEFPSGLQIYRNSRAELNISTRERRTR
ncbi:MAG: DUF2079 domain-containing protein [Proteobacteria bacterium]|nr:DUF2079 domain-containing protein [Pseudomonadota bacterium]